MEGSLQQRSIESNFVVEAAKEGSQLGLVVVESGHVSCTVCVERVAFRAQNVNSILVAAHVPCGMMRMSLPRPLKIPSHVLHTAAGPLHCIVHQTMDIDPLASREDVVQQDEIHVLSDCSSPFACRHCCCLMRMWCADQRHQCQQSFQLVRETRLDSRAKMRQHVVFSTILSTWVKTKSDGCTLPTLTPTLLHGLLSLTLWRSLPRCECQAIGHDATLAPDTSSLVMMLFAVHAC